MQPTRSCRIRIVTNVTENSTLVIKKGNKTVIYPSTGSLTVFLPCGYNKVVNVAQENGERRERKRVKLSILAARMGVSGWVKGKCRFQSDEEARAMLQFHGAGVLRFSQAINKKGHINS